EPGAQAREGAGVDGPARPWDRAAQEPGQLRLVHRWRGQPRGPLRTFRGRILARYCGRRVHSRGQHRGPEDTRGGDARLRGSRVSLARRSNIQGPRTCGRLSSRSRPSTRRRAGRIGRGRAPALRARCGSYRDLSEGRSRHGGGDGGGGRVALTRGDGVRGRREPHLGLPEAGALDSRGPRRRRRTYRFLPASHTQRCNDRAPGYARGLRRGGRALRQPHPLCRVRRAGWGAEKTSGGVRGGAAPHEGGGHPARSFPGRRLRGLQDLLRRRWLPRRVAASPPGRDGRLRCPRGCCDPGDERGDTGRAGFRLEPLHHRREGRGDLHTYRGRAGGDHRL
ncbi:MAG: hypothetical protein AVDCRST_MAG14-2087, partial [uncultured Rubrobacteraceae bacterium]